MTTNLVTVTPTTSVVEINRIFEEHSFHHIPVVDGGGLVGIISKQDFLQVSHALSYNWSGDIDTDRSFHDFAARDMMTEYPMNLNPDDTIGLAADIFMANKFHALPIIDDDELVGMITTHDLIAYAFKSPVVSSL
ncbi:MAG: CBS domain-containing protein [Saprospiraceae bacterium]|nr:CBS domain-containing protein [Saprospiraceae bacterium]